MNRVLNNLFINALGFVCLTLLWPSGASAQESVTFSRIIRADREAGAVFIRAGSDATFERFTAMSRRSLEHPYDITPQDIVDGNPGKIIFVCRLRGGGLRLSRNPATHDRCAPRNRSYWLVRGLTYLVPSAMSHVIPDVREEIESLHREVRSLSERLNARENSIQERAGESQEIETQAVPAPVPVSNSTTSVHESASVSNGAWYALIGLLLGMSVMFFFVIFVRSRDKKAWEETLYAQELYFSDLTRRLHNRACVYIRTLRRRYRKVISHRDGLIQSLERELRETQNTQKKQEEEIELLSDKSDVHALKEPAVEHIGVDLHASDDDPRNRPGVDAPADDFIQKSLKTDQEILIGRLKADLLVVKAKLDRRLEATERIPRLMNEIDKLKPDGHDKLVSQLRMFVSHRNDALRRAGFSDDKIDPDRAGMLMIELSYDRLIAETQDEIDKFEESDEGKRSKALQEELNSLFEEVTGLYGYSSSMESSLERDRRAIDALHTEMRGELRAVELLQERLRKKLADTGRGFPIGNEEPTRKMQILPRESADDSEKPARTEERLAELEGRVRGQTRRMRELQEQVSQLKTQLGEYEGASDERMSELQAEVKSLSGQLAESFKREAALLNENRTLHQSSWKEKKAGLFFDANPPKRTRRRKSSRTGLVATSRPPPPLQPVDRAGILRFSDALVKLMDKIGPSLDEGCFLPMDRSSVIDLARLLGRATVENPFQTGDHVPLYILPNYLMLQCNGKLPERLRSQTIKPPGTHQ